MKTDMLSSVAQEVENEISRMSLVAYYCEDLESLWIDGAEPEGDRKPASAVLEWDHSRGGYSQFLKTAKSLGMEIVYLKIKHFSWQLDLYEPLEQSGAKSMSALQKRAQDFKCYDGFVEYIIFAFKLNDVWHTYQEVADWHMDYAKVLDAAEG